MSDFFNKYPYTDFHEMNLDWVIERVKKLTEDWLATQEAWNNTQEEWQQLYDYVHDYFANLDVQDEINNKINQMILDGTFMTIVTPTINQTVIDATTAWLADHITQPTTPAIDNSLTIQGAAADAQRTGLLAAPIYNASSSYNIGDYVLYNGYVWRCTTTIVGGETWDSSHWIMRRIAPEITSLRNDSVIPREQTSGNFTDFNDIKKNGNYLVNSSLTHGYIDSNSHSYQGNLNVFSWNPSGNYGTMQLYTNSDGKQYSRLYWNSTWTDWKKITVEDLVELNARNLDYLSNSVNILNPAEFLNRGYYIDFTDGVTHVTNGGYELSEKIYVGDILNLYCRQTYSTTDSHIILIYCYDKDDTYLGYRSARYSDIGNSEYKYTLPGNTAYVIIATNNAAVSGSQICISTVSLASFVNFGTLYQPIKCNTNKLNNTKIVNFGDSIFGNKRPPEDVSTAIAYETGATVYNLGFGGCQMSQAGANWDAFSMYQLAYAIANNDFTVQDAADMSGLPYYFPETLALLKSIDFSEIDIITIAYGTNDFTSGVQLNNALDPDDTSTFEGALRYSLELIMAAYPQLHIFVCTPTWRFWLSGGVYTDDSDTHQNSNNDLLTDFVSSCESVSAEYHLTCINNYDQLGINKFNRDNWFPANDGTHHNPAGARLIAQHMVNEMF